jgi:hypothetical protein
MGRQTWRKHREHANDPSDRGDILSALHRDVYKHNGKLRVRWHAEEPPSSEIPSCLTRYVPLYRYTAALYARYVAEGRCTEKQLRTVYALMIEGMSMHEFARIENVEPEAIRQRVLGLANKCPEFYRWWCRLHEGRRRQARQPARRQARKD